MPRYAVRIKLLSASAADFKRLSEQIQSGEAMAPVTLLRSERTPIQVDEYICFDNRFENLSDANARILKAISVTGKDSLFTIMKKKTVGHPDFSLHQELHKQ